MQSRTGVGRDGGISGVGDERGAVHGSRSRCVTSAAAGCCGRHSRQVVDIDIAYDGMDQGSGQGSSCLQPHVSSTPAVADASLATHCTTALHCFPLVSV